MTETKPRISRRLGKDMYEHVSKVYFIEAVGLDLVKIGYAADVPERLRKLAPGCPAPLRLLGTVPGGLQIERHYHERLAGHRTRGEWFRKCDALDAIVAGIDKPAPSPDRAKLRANRQAAKMKAAYEENADRLFREWDEKRESKAAARAAKVIQRTAERRETAEQIAARLG